MTLNIEEISFQIILNGGNARSLAAESINHAKAGEFKLAEQKIEEANEAMTIAHRFQTANLANLLALSTFKFICFFIKFNDFFCQVNYCHGIH